MTTKIESLEIEITEEEIDSLSDELAETIVSVLMRNRDRFPSEAGDRITQIGFETENPVAALRLMRVEGLLDGEKHEEVL